MGSSDPSGLLESPGPIPAMRDQAIRLHVEGALAEAERLYRQVLALQPRDCQALMMLGVLAAQSGRLPEAERLLRAALSIDAGQPLAHNNLGIVLTEQQRYEEAVDCFERATALAPAYAEAYLNRGAALEHSGQLEGALASYDRAIELQPASATAHSNRGSVLRELGRHAEALRSCDRAVALAPASAKAHINRAAALRELGRLEEALASAQSAIAQAPQLADAYVTRGDVQYELHRFEEALASYDQALALAPDDASALGRRGGVLCRLGRPAEALESCERAVVLAPDAQGVHVNRGLALQDVGRLEEALASYDRAIALDPDDFTAHNNRGTALVQMGRFEEALASYDRWIARRPGDVEARFNKSMCHLALGDLEEGWRLFELRKKRKLPIAVRRVAQPEWLGEPDPRGRTLLVHSEQGFGDVLQFCRYARLLAERGARVILEVPPALVRLLESGLADVAQIVASGSPLPPFDLHCPVMSLPFAFKTTLSSIPGRVPYIKSDPNRVALWQERLGPRRGLRVGLVWSGGFRAHQPELWAVNRRRNIALSKLAALRHADVELYSLQKGQPAESEPARLREAGWDGPELIDHTALLEDFSDTAALLECLDLLISVDTSTAHLAGALGRPVWLLNRFDTCWRWLLGRSDCPWYPTLRIYRQDSPGDWDGVVRKVSADLSRVAAAPLSTARSHP